MKNDHGEYHVGSESVPPAYMFNLLRAAYGSRIAEGIFRSHGLNPPATILHGVQKSCVAF
jgi:hypothetical protein